MYGLVHLLANDVTMSADVGGKAWGAASRSLDTPTTVIYSLSLPRRSSDLLAVFGGLPVVRTTVVRSALVPRLGGRLVPDRKSTRLNSSHGSISYAAFSLEKNTPSAWAICTVWCIC